MATLTQQAQKQHFQKKVLGIKKKNPEILTKDIYYDALRTTSHMTLPCILRQALIKK